MRKFLSGFTLAEVLITLTIIGVVASITLPSLQANVNKTSMSSQISKTYSQLASAINLYMAKEDLVNLSNDFDITYFARNYLHVQYVCNGSDDTNCFADTYFAINDAKKEMSRASLPAGQGFILKDGTVIRINNNGIFFDVNNKKSPNKPGYDLQYVALNRDGTLGPSKSDIFEDPAKRDETIKKNFQICLNGHDYSEGCFIHLLRNNFKFDY